MIKTWQKLATHALVFFVPMVGTAVAHAQPAEITEMSAGETQELQPGDTAQFASSSDAVLVIDAYRAEQDAPNCITWREGKGFTQITNGCQTDLPIKVYYDHDKQSACETVVEGTTHNLGYAGWDFFRRNVERVVTC